MTILVVDNHRERLDRLANSLRGIPTAEIFPFIDPMLAVKYSFEHPVDVVLTDIPMKRMDGFLLLERVRQNNPDVQVFFVADTNEYAHEANEKGGNGYLVRPITPTAISEITAQIIEGEVRT